MGGNALEVAPACRGLVLLNGTFGHFKGEVVFGHTVEGTGLHVRGRCAFADDASDAETVLEGAIQNTFHVGRDD